MRENRPEAVDGLGQADGLAALFGAFMELADRLAMSGMERAGILGITEASLALGPDSLRVREGEARRRLDYAMPLMQRQLTNLARN